jgi:MFS family permease
MDSHKHFHMLHNKEIDEFFFNMGVRSFVFALVSVFIPIFLLDLGFSLVDIFLVYLVMSIVHICAAFASAFVSSKIGFKHTIIISQPFLIAFFLVLFSMELYSLPLILIPITYGLYSGLFWAAFHSDFAKFSDDGKQGSEVAFRNIIASLLSIVAPVAGGVIVAFFSFGHMFIFVIFLIIISVFPLFLTKDSKADINFSLKNIFSKRRIDHTLGYFGYGLLARGFGVIWPIFLFTLILDKNYLGLGALTSLFFFFSFISTLVIGKKFDKHNKGFIRKIFGFSGLVWLAKLFVLVPVFAYVADSLHGLTKPANEITVDAVTYEHAKPNVLEYILYRETMIHIGIILAMAILVVIPNLFLGLVIASIGSFFMIFLQK